jgi:hypothetical protein
MSYVGWVLFVLTLVWAVKSMNFSHQKRLALNYYMAYLLLDDGMRQKHQADLLKWIKESDAPNASTLARRTWFALERMADTLAAGASGVPGSALGATGMLWTVKKSGSIAAWRGN